MGPWVNLAWWQWIGILGVSGWNALSAGVEALWEMGLIFVGSALILTLITAYIVGFTRKLGGD